MTLEKVLALFLLADYEVLGIKKVPNQRMPDREDIPWWEVTTEDGVILIGWRKSVIAIDWSRTELRGIVTDQDVTKDSTHVHAWSYGDAVNALSNLHNRRFIKLPQEN